VALLNLCYVFYIFFVKRIKWCTVLHIIIKWICQWMEYPLTCPKQDWFARLTAKYKQNAVEANLPLRETDVRYFDVYGMINWMWNKEGQAHRRWHHQSYLKNWIILSPTESAVLWRNWIENGYVWAIIG